MTNPPSNPRPPGQDAHDAEVVEAMARAICAGEGFTPDGPATPHDPTPMWMAWSDAAEDALSALPLLPASARLALARRLCPEMFAELELLEEVCAFYANDEDRFLREEGEPYGSIPTEVGMKARSARHRFREREAAASERTP